MLDWVRDWWENLQLFLVEILTQSSNKWCTVRNKKTCICTNRKIIWDKELSGNYAFQRKDNRNSIENRRDEVRNTFWPKRSMESDKRKTGYHYRFGSIEI